MKIQKIVLFFMASALSTVTVLCADTETSPSKVAVELATFGLPDSLEDIVPGWISEEDYRKWQAESGFTIEYLRKRHALILERHYTEEELKEVVDFLNSEAGQRWLEITASREFGGSGVADEMSKVMQERSKSLREFPQTRREQDSDGNAEKPPGVEREP